MSTTTVHVEPFKIIGISSWTTNADGQAVIDLGMLWNRFRAENMVSLIPNRLANDIYAIYTDYMTDHRGGLHGDHRMQGQLPGQHTSGIDGTRIQRRPIQEIYRKRKNASRGYPAMAGNLERG